MIGISIEERAIKLAHYIIESKDTVRGAAKKFGISKSTVQYINRRKSYKACTLYNRIKRYSKRSC